MHCKDRFTDETSVDQTKKATCSQLLNCSCEMLTYKKFTDFPYGLPQPLNFLYKVIKFKNMILPAL